VFVSFVTLKKLFPFRTAALVLLLAGSFAQAQMQGQKMAQTAAATIREFIYISAPYTSAHASFGADGKAKPIGLIQPVLIPMGGKRIRLFARSTLDIGKICVTDSSDLGGTWSEAHMLDVANPNSGIDPVKLRDGRIAMIYNNTTSGRSPLNLGVSTDGEHFRDFVKLECEAGEFSFLAMVQAKDGNLKITYTYDRRQIRYVEYPLAAIPKEFFG